FRKKSPISWRTFCLGLSAIFLLFGIGFQHYYSYGNSKALKEDPSIFLITIENWKMGSIADMPALKKSLGDCSSFSPAVTPHTDTRVSAASILTGLHPLKNSVYRSDSRLSSRHTTLGTLLRKERYATAAFLSNRSLERSSGLSRGFELYDDDTSTHLRGIYNLHIMKLLGFSGPMIRSDEATLAGARQWMDDIGDMPLFAWVQLSSLGRSASEPMLSEKERLAAYEKEQEQLDGLLASFLDDIQKRDPNSIIALTGTQGISLGERGIHPPARGLYRESLAVPLVFCSKKTEGKTYDGLVRTFDLFNTILAQVPLPIRKNTDSAELLFLQKSESFVGFNTIVMSPDLNTGIENAYIGMYFVSKQSQQLYKYLWGARDRKYALFNLTKDAEEAFNIAQEQPILRQNIHKSIEKVHKKLEGGEP
ncbi:MAG: sulfatase-like hydrolase/transferase, partial [Myxococcota bacterium]|nr:sulfatase-like hydrolase/transferase [Myxococcota bacterium]